jgi:hypothetical protein
VDTKEHETLDYSPIDVNGGLFVGYKKRRYNQLICLVHIEGEVVVLAPHCQVSDLLPIGCLIVVGDQAYYSTVLQYC